MELTVEEKKMAEIETLNKFLVASKGKEIGFLKPVPGSMSADDALLLAAYLVTMAEVSATHKFQEVLDAVEGA